jgi:hypothetical protein
VNVVNAVNVAKPVTNARIEPKISKQEPRLSFRLSASYDIHGIHDIHDIHGIHDFHGF